MPEVARDVPALRFVVYCRPQPQGSSRAFYNKRMGRAIITSDNSKLKPYRQEVTQTVLAELAARHLASPIAGKHIACWLELDFYLEKPASVPRRREYPVVKPDLDKLIRATKDALKGALYADDGQVVGLRRAEKHYGIPERVEISFSLERA